LSSAPGIACRSESVPRSASLPEGTPFSSSSSAVRGRARVEAPQVDRSGAGFDRLQRARCAGAHHGACFDARAALLGRETDEQPLRRALQLGDDGGREALVGEAEIRAGRDRASRGERG
jgi:hypothetical protein